MLPLLNSKTNKNTGQNCSTYSFTITNRETGGNLCSPAAVSPNFHRFRRCHCGRNGSIASQSKRCVSKKFHGKTNQMRTSQKTCHMVVSHFLCLEEGIGSAKEMPRRCFQ